MRRHLAVVLGCAALVAVATAVPAGARTGPAGGSRNAGVGSGDLVVAWNQELLRIVRTPGQQPATVHPTRSFALLHAAIWDAVTSTTHSGPSYLVTVHARPGASPRAAVAQAGHDTLAALYPAQRAALDTRLTAELATLPDDRARTDGRRVGALTAEILLAARSNDGSAVTPPPYTPGPAPDAYRPTPPAFAAPVFTHWGAVTPWVIDTPDRFLPAPYPALDSQAYQRASDEVRRLGQDTSTARTADQTTQARFWAAPIWNCWNEIAQTVATARHTDLVRTARLFAELNLTFADGAIAFYDAKYRFAIWRPVTALRSTDPGWTPLATTPADPSYPGAHSVIGQAGAVVLTRWFGPHAHFTVTSEALPGVTRSFGGFQAAADEAGLSRIYAGVHTRLDHVAGQRLGRAVAVSAGHALHHG
jgi:membrane-associated phospholipid phosphatase